MTKKEMKNVAKQIVKYETVLRNNPTPEDKYQAEQAIINITNKINDFEAMFAIDKIVADMLTQVENS